MSRRRLSVRAGVATLALAAGSVVTASGGAFVDDAAPRVRSAAVASGADSSRSALPRRPRSLAGRRIEIVRIGHRAPRRVLVVGCIHGDECAGVAIVEDLEALRPVPGVALWAIENLNPDGLARGTRGNAAGVDLNRNFPYRWRASGHRTGIHYPGGSPLSEPESQLAARLIRRLRPAVTIWFHQPLGVVDLSGGDARIERRYAAMIGLPVHRLARYHGSATGWQDHVLPRSTAFVVELPAGRLSAGAARREAGAIVRLANRLAVH